MREVMVFEKEDGKQLVKDFDQMLWHISNPSEEDKKMAVRVKAVHPVEGAVFTESEIKQVQELLVFLAKYADDSEGFIEDAIQMVERKLK